MSVPDGGAPVAAHPEFVVEDVLGRGGSATVYRVRDTSTGRDVAWKVWDAPLDAAARERFDAECSVHAALSEHPRIVRLLGRAQPAEGERPWITTELHEASLERWLTREDVTLAQWRVMAEDLLVGLAAVHASGHVHRDVKPGNVLEAGGRWSLGDLGTAHPVDVPTDDGAAGTASFIAPELGRTGSSPTPGSDVYSAATTLQLALDRVRPSEDVPAALEGLLTRASSEHPADRPAGARELLDRLRDALPPVPPPAVDPVRRSRARRLLVGALVVALLVAGTVVWRQVSADSETAAGQAAGEEVCERLPQPDPLTFPDGPVLSGVEADGYVTDGHISVEIAGRVADPGTLAERGTLWFVGVPSPESVGRDLRPGSGYWYPMGVVETDAAGCFVTVPLQLSSYDAAQGVVYRMNLAVLGPELDERSRAMVAENSSAGLGVTAETPPGVEVVGSFDLPTAGFDQL